MNHLFFGKLDAFVTIYLNKILVFCHSTEAHGANLHWVFNQLQKHSFKAKVKRYCFGMQILQYLGYMIILSVSMVEPKEAKAIDKC